MSSQEEQVTFKFLEFNARRHARKVEAARVEVTYAGQDQVLWMSKSDLQKNLQIYNDDPELLKALGSYHVKLGSANAAKKGIEL